jgi:hypothetical protein
MRINEKDKKQDANQQRCAISGFRDAHDDTAGNEECTDEIQKKIPGGQAVGHGQETFHEFLYAKLYDTEGDDGESEQIFAGFEEFLHQRPFV